VLKFNKIKIYDTVGEILALSTECKQRKTIGIVYQFLCKIYDKNTNLVTQYTTSQKGVFKTISKEMHRVGEGSVECVCHSHPRLR
jgi:hypothetical protein